MSANEPNPVERHFDSVASSYQTASTKSYWSGIRNRQSAVFMSLVGDVAGREVLELGCGAGYYTRLMLAAGARNIVAVDLSARMLDALPKERIEPVLADAITLDLGRRFDTLVSAGMLEFVPDPRAALLSAARHANSGAAFSILFPTRTLLGRAYRMFHRRHGFTVTLFDEQSLARLLEGSGWRLDRTIVSGPFSACARLIRMPATTGAQS